MNDVALFIVSLLLLAANSWLFTGAVGNGDALTAAMFAIGSVLMGRVALQAGTRLSEARSDDA